MLIVGNPESAVHVPAQRSLFAVTFSSSGAGSQKNTHFDRWLSNLLRGHTRLFIASFGSLSWLSFVLHDMSCAMGQEQTKALRSPISTDQR